MMWKGEDKSPDKQMVEAPKIIRALFWTTFFPFALLKL